MTSCGSDSCWTALTPFRATQLMSRLGRSVSGSKICADPKFSPATATRKTDLPLRSSRRFSGYCEPNDTIKGSTSPQQAVSASSCQRAQGMPNGARSLRVAPAASMALASSISGTDQLICPLSSSGQCRRTYTPSWIGWGGRVGYPWVTDLRVGRYRYCGLAHRALEYVEMGSSPPSTTHHHA